MIDYDTVRQTGDHSVYDRLTALLIGLVAVLAASLVVVQAVEGQREARANATSARLAADITARVNSPSDLVIFLVHATQEALQVGIEGTGRQLVALNSGDPAQSVIGEADYEASNLLIGIAARMATEPDTSDGLDPYVADVMSTTQAELDELGAQQNAAADEAAAAGRRSSQAVLGISVVALGGVLVGLAAVLGGGRAGRILLLLAWIAAAIGLGGLLLAVGLVATPF